MAYPLDATDQALIAILRHDGRRSVSDISATLGVTRNTVRTRMDRLRKAGVIQGFSVILKEDMDNTALRAIMMLGIEGKNMSGIIRRLSGMPEVQAIWSTNGRWDLVVELVVSEITKFDRVLAHIRLFEGVAATETSLYLANHKRSPSLLPGQGADLLPDAGRNPATAAGRMGGRPVRQDRP